MYLVVVLTKEVYRTKSKIRACIIERQDHNVGQQSSYCILPVHTNTHDFHGSVNNREEEMKLPDLAGKEGEEG